MTCPAYPTIGHDTFPRESFDHDNSEKFPNFQLKNNRETDKMSIAISYIAVKGETKENIWTTLSLEQSDENLEPLSGAQIKNGWYLIIDGTFRLFENEEALKSLSKNAEVITASVVEGENFCAASGWQLCEKIWSVEHDLGKGNDHLEVSGLPPKELEPIKTANEQLLKSKKANWDCYFSIPVDLFESLVGINYGILYPPEYFESTDFLTYTEIAPEVEKLISFGEDGKSLTMNFNSDET